jgi:protein-tyrosine-phosphatase
MTILFVCSGNTCRSPLAVAAWRTLDNCTRNLDHANRVDDASNDNVKNSPTAKSSFDGAEVESAGTRGLERTKSDRTHRGSGSFVGRRFERTSCARVEHALAATR